MLCLDYEYEKVDGPIKKIFPYQEKTQILIK